MDETVQALRLDFETVFHIGSVAYDHFAVSCKHLGAHPPSLRAKDKFEFHELVEHLDSKSPSPIARALGDELAPEIRWLHYWMRSYRNGFIVHPDRPLQQSLIHGPGSKFVLFTPANVGWNDDDALAREINALLPHAPKAIRDADPTYWERARPRALLQRVLQNIGAIASFEERQRIASIARRSGHETPSFQIVASVFPDVIARALPVVRDTALQNRVAIDLGTKDSRWVVPPRRSLSV